jgi:hypothetical protein
VESLGRADEDEGDDDDEDDEVVVDGSKGGCFASAVRNRLSVER